MKLRFTPQATANLVAIADYIRARNPEAAKRVRDDIYTALRNLLLFPGVGRRQMTTGVRKLVTRRFSYLIYYAVDDAAEEIIILSVQHPAQERAYSDE